MSTTIAPDAGGPAPDDADRRDTFGGGGPTGAHDDVEELLGTIDRSLIALEQRVRRLPAAGEPIDAEERALLSSVVLALVELFERVDGRIAAGGVSSDVRARRDDEHLRFEVLRSQVVERTGAAVATDEAPAAPPSPAPRARRTRTLVLVGTAITITGALLVGFVLFQFWVTDLSEQRSQRNLVGPFEERLLDASAEESGVGENASAEAFAEYGGEDAYAEAQEAAEQEAEVDTGPPPRGTPVALLQIESIDVEKIVVEGTGAEDLKQGPGHYRNSPMPGREGNAVIAGKRTTYGEPFRNLDQLEEGDEITAITTDGVFTYVVSDTRVVEPGDPDVLAQGDGNTLTLVTAEPEYQASQRYVVVADLEGEPVVLEGEEAEAVTDDPPPLTPDETGLARDAAAWAPVLFWGELLLVAMVVTAVVYRRWPRWSAWLVTTPILLALAFLWFESLNRLLPSTL